MVPVATANALAKTTSMVLLARMPVHAQTVVSAWTALAVTALAHVRLVSMARLALVFVTALPDLDVMTALQVLACVSACQAHTELTVSPCVIA